MHSQTALVALLIVAFAGLPSTDARALAGGATRLDTEQVRSVLAASYEAHKGRYLTTRVLGNHPPEITRLTEFWLDAEDGRLRFTRYSLKDRVTGQETITLMEYTRLPSRFCATGETHSGRTLAINHRHWGGQWREPFNSNALTFDLVPILDFVEAPAGELSDEGLQVVDGRSVRTLAWRPADSLARRS